MKKDSPEIQLFSANEEDAEDFIILEEGGEFYQQQSLTANVQKQLSLSEIRQRLAQSNTPYLKSIEHIKQLND